MLKKLITVVLILAATGLQWAQTNCNITVRTTPVTCHGGADGKAEILVNGQLVVINDPGNGNNSGAGCASPIHQPSPVNCSNAPSGAITITQTSGTVTMGGGNTYLLTQAFNGTKFVFNGPATLITCQSVSLSGIMEFTTAEPVQIYQTSTMIINGKNPVLPSNVIFRSYASLQLVNGVPVPPNEPTGLAQIHGQLYNYASLQLNGNLYVSGLIQNEVPLQLPGNVEVAPGGVINNRGVMHVPFELNVKGSFINNCELSLGTLKLEGSLVNHAKIDLAWGSGAIFTSGTYQAGGNSYIKTNTFLMTGSVLAEGIGSTCALVQVSGNSTIAQGAIFQGNINFCQGTGTTMNNGTFQNGASASCTCNATGVSTGGGGSSNNGGVDGTITWSYGTPILHGSTTTGLYAGTYSVSVDIEGCNPVTLNYTITEPAALSASLAWNETTKIATVTASGGNSGAYTYVWTDGVTTSNNVRDLTGKAVGTYCVEVRDSKGCASTPMCATIEGPEIEDPEVCNIVVQTTTNGQIMINPLTGETCCEWRIVTSTHPEGVSGSITLNRPCEDSTITLLNCNDVPSWHVIRGRNDGCGNGCIDCCPNPSNPDCGDPRLQVTWTAVPARCLLKSMVTLTVTGNIRQNDIRISAPGNATIEGYSVLGLPPGQHVLTVFDLTSHISVDVTVTVPATPAISLSLLQIPDPAVAVSNEFSMLVNSATGPYNILFPFFPGTASGVVPVNNTLGPFSIPVEEGNGPFFVTVSDVYCNDTTFTVFREKIICTTQTFTPQLTLNRPSFAGRTDGSISIANTPLPSGAVAEWTGTAIARMFSGTILNGIGAGTYRLLVRSTTDNCILFQSDAIVLLDGPSFEVSVSVNGCTATAQLTVRDSEGNVLATPSPLSYRWINPFNVQTVSTASAPNLASLDLAGSPEFLRVEVTDASGRTGYGDVVVPANCLPACSSSLEYKVIPPTCFGGSNGIIQILAASGGTVTWVTPNYGGDRWTWLKTGLGEGLYEVQVHPANCPSPVSYFIGIQNPPSLQLSREDVNPSSTVVTVANGTSPYTFKWSDIATPVESIPASITRTGLVAGTTYKVIVTDVKGCTDTLEFVYNPCSISAPHPFPLYKVENNSVEVFANGGTGPFEDYQFFWDRQGAPELSNQYGPVKFNLSPDTYTITVTDANGCTGSVVYVHPGCDDLLDDLNVITVNASSASVCDGIATIEIDNVTDLSGYAIRWDDQEIEQLLQRSDGLRAVQEESSIRIINTCCGVHTVFVYRGGEEACAVEREFEIDCGITEPPSCENSDLNITVLGSSTVERNCSDAPVNLNFTVSGGLMPYRYQWTYTKPGSDPMLIPSAQPGFTNAPVGQYVVLVLDAMDCPREQSFTVNGATSTLSVEQQVTQATCENGNGSATITATGGSGSKTIAWLNSSSNAFTRNDLAEGNTYEYTITDQAGCAYSGAVSLEDLRIDNSLRNTTDSLCPEKTLTLLARYLPGYSTVWSSTTGGVTIENPNADMLTVSQNGVYVLTRQHLTNPTGCPAHVETTTVVTKTYCPTSQPCETFRYEFPEIEPVDLCTDNLTFAANASARNKFDLYIEQVKRDFTNNFVNSTMNSLQETLTMSYSDKEQHYTLYYYDQAGNLVRTVPPAGVRPLDDAKTNEVADYWSDLHDNDATNNPTAIPNVTTQHTLASSYKYNSLNQLIAQDIPDHSQQDLWEQQQSLSIPGQTVATMDANGNKVWAFANSANEAFLYTSNDAGEHYLGGLTLELGNILDMQRMGAAGETYMAVGTGGLILKASNGAANWNIITGPTTTDLIKVHFTDGTNGFIIDASGNIWRTSNGGADWTSASSSVSDNGNSLGTLANSLSGKTISDISVRTHDGAAILLITANDASRGYVFHTKNFSTFAFTTALVGLNMVYGQPSQVVYDGTNTEILYYNSVFRKTGSTSIEFNRALSGLSGTADRYLSNGSVHVVTTSTSQLFLSTDGNNFTVNTTIPSAAFANLVNSNNRIAAFNTTSLYRVQNNGTITTTTYGSNVNCYYYNPANNVEYVGLNNSTIVDITNNTTFTLPVAVNQFVVDGTVALLYRNSGAAAYRLGTTVVAGNIVGEWSHPKIVYYGNQNYLANWSGELKQLTVNNSGATPVVSLSSTTSGMVPTSSIPFALTGSASQLVRIQDLKIQLKNNGSSDVEMTLKSQMNSATVAGNKLYAFANSGVVFSQADQSIGSVLNFNQADIALFPALKKNTLNSSGVIRISASNNKLYRLTGVASSVASFTEEVATPALTAAVKSFSQDYLLTTDGKVYKATTTSGVTTWTQEAGTFTNFNVINGTASTILAGGDNTAIKYNAGTGWLSPAAFKAAPIRDAAVSANGNTLVAVGDAGTILVSTNGGSSFKPLKAPDATNLTAVSLYSNGFVTAASNGAIYYFSSLTSTSYTTLKVANAQPVRKLMAQGTKLWALRGINVLYSDNATELMPVLSAGSELYDITINNDNYGYIVGSSGVAYRIVPTGITEEAESTVITPVALADGKQVKLIPTDNNILDDAGTGIPPSHLRNVRFTDRLVGHITGTGGIVLKTTDGGYHWKPEGAYSSTNTPMLVFNGNEHGVYADGNILGVIRDRAQTLGSRFWYDELGRLVLSQNSKQYNIQSYLNEIQYSGIEVPGNPTTRVRAYSYTLYDDIGRITEVGELLTREALTTHKHESQVLYSTAKNYIRDGAKHQLTRTYYDRIAFPNLREDFIQENLRPRVASVTYQDREGAYERATHYSYDIHGNVNTLLQEIHVGDETMMKRLDYDYDLISGNVHYVYFQKDQPDGFTHHYSYDGDNRIKEVFTSTDNVIWNKEAKYDYYAHGPLARMTTGRDEVDQCDYAYTLQGWIKGVNAQKFSYALGYYNNDYSSVGTSTLQTTPMAKQLYNGNISTMTTQNPGLAHIDPLKPTTYTQQYTYDQLNRITGSTVATQGANHKTTYSYDANGNIETLQRYDATGVLFDNMAYKYHKVDEGYLKNTNRLRWVDDAVTTTERTDDIEDQSRDNYGYDDIGNLIKDEQEEIARIEWNVYGKVDAVIRTAESTTRADLFFEYDASGNRVSKTVVKDGMTSTTFYLRDATGNVMSVYKKEGAVAPELEEQYIYGSSRLGVYKPGEDVSTELEIGLTSSRHTIGRRNYEYSDHLGNVRVVFSDAKHSSLSMVAAYEYYPFGMILDQVGTSRHTYNGKEYDEEIGWQDYGMRMYNPNLARFFRVDPITKFYPELTPYQYASNSPIKFIDIDGLERGEPGYGAFMGGLSLANPDAAELEAKVVKSPEFLRLQKAMAYGMLTGAAAIVASRVFPYVIYNPVLYNELGAGLYGAAGGEDEWPTPAISDNITRGLRRTSNIGAEIYRFIKGAVPKKTIQDVARTVGSEIFDTGIKNRGLLQEYALKTKYQNHCDINVLTPNNNNYPIFDLIDELGNIVDVTSTTMSKLSKQKWISDKLYKVNAMASEFGTQGTVQIYLKKGQYTQEQIANFKKTLNDHIELNEYENVKVAVDEIEVK